MREGHRELGCPDRDTELQGGGLGPERSRQTNALFCQLALTSLTTDSSPGQKQGIGLAKGSFHFNSISLIIMEIICRVPSRHKRGCEHYKIQSYSQGICSLVGKAGLYK